ncbi:hypothetical protein E2C01_043586 [Portunus trituberculatus]|uniref:Uncharacterized protein n=1 Tax=Portunus trituberculatus TaxID=210409 RepID=A0A5B7FTC1_PORTR|nr:hypothetical protein [Portunus trituberculatus]
MRRIPRCRRPSLNTAKTDPTTTITTTTTSSTSPPHNERSAAPVLAGWLRETVFFSLYSIPPEDSKHRFHSTRQLPNHLTITTLRLSF